MAVSPAMHHRLLPPCGCGNSSAVRFLRGPQPELHPNIMNTLEIKGDWTIIKGKLKQKWAKLTDDDLQYASGKQEELLGRIQKRTGESREAVEKAIKESTDSCCK